MKYKVSIYLVLTLSLASVDWTDLNNQILYEIELGYIKDITKPNHEIILAEVICPDKNKPCYEDDESAGR